MYTSITNDQSCIQGIQSGIYDYVQANFATKQCCTENPQIYVHNITGVIVIYWPSTKNVRNKL